MLSLQKEWLNLGEIELLNLQFTFSDQNFVCRSYLSHACYMPRPF